MSHDGDVDKAAIREFLSLSYHLLPGCEVSRTNPLSSHHGILIPALQCITESAQVPSSRILCVPVLTLPSSGPSEPKEPAP
jgi:hypothetical protein